MDQQELRELEKRCIQEEPPFCTAACPLHVDVRAFAGRMKEGDWDGAMKILSRFMPQPGILGRICDAPCELRCRRGDVGEAIAIHALERTCAEMNLPPPRTVRLPSKPGRIAVAGGGLSSLAAAWDLVRKGYSVTLFEEGTIPASILYSLDPSRLPAESIQKEISRLIEQGVAIECNVWMDAPETWARWMTDFDAVYLGLDSVSGKSWDISRNDAREIIIEPGIQSTGMEKAFAGGRPEQRRGSPVFLTSEGRWAAVSIDRFLQGVSVTAGREKEGPYETRLFTSIAGVSPSARQTMSDPVHGYNEEEAIKEAQRCLACECLECVKVCVYLEHYKAYPRRYAREIYNNGSIVLGERKANRLINSCSLCGLCERVCPNDFAMQDLCLSARRAMTAAGKMPPSAHEFALLDLAFSRSDRFSMARHQPGKASSKWIFFPGCQWPASAPGQVERTYSHLCDNLKGDVGLILSCCGAPALWAGNQDIFSESLSDMETRWKSLGSSRLVTACSSCYRIFKENLPQIPVVSLWEVLEETLGPEIKAGTKPETVAVLDPCTSRYQNEMQQSVRRLVKRLGVEIRELDLAGEFTECCGYGGLMQNANPELARNVASRRAGRSPADYLTYCAMCRDNMARVGKRAVYLMDLIFPDEREPEPAERRRPGWSERRENRERLKEGLLCRLWKEEAIQSEPWRSIRIGISPEVADLIEKRRILLEDIQQTIYHGETTGRKMFIPGRGLFKAVYRPNNVTFWVEYSLNAEGFQVRNAYSHRMEVIGP
jgi:glutamate synthase (NADPH) small chain